MGRVTLGLCVALVAGGGGGCRERAQAVQSEASVREMVRQLRRQAERVTGLQYKHDVAVLLRSRDRVREYVVHKFDEDLPPAELAGATAAYKLFGLIPDSLDLRRTMIDLLTEQVAGYYDPDSGALFIPTDVDDPFRIRLVVSHELIHALQDQYVSLDSIINQRRRNDRRSAAQAVLEGQATFYQIPMMMPEQRPETLPPHWFWRQRSAMAQQQAQMPQFAGAPLWLRETLIFPYLGGADFVGWFARTHPGREPFGAAMPVSTEQILHPDRYAAGDEPVALAFTGSDVDTVRYEDGLGEFEIGLLFTQLLHDSSESRGPAYATDWGGDRFRVYGPAADALVWYSVWDDAAARDRFARGLQRVWAARRAGDRARRYQIDTLAIDGRPGARLVDAPVAWKGWDAVPAVRVVR
jgi:hypothetical protein